MEHEGWTLSVVGMTRPTSRSHLNFQTPSSKRPETNICRRREQHLKNQTWAYSEQGLNKFFYDKARRNQHGRLKAIQCKHLPCLCVCA